MQTLDGYIEGSNGSLDWHAVDEEYNDFAVEQLNTADTLLFGRKTYELMHNYWTTEQAFEKDPIVAQKMNAVQKGICSHTEQEFSWNNSFFLGTDIFEAITNLKNREGKNILIFGSAQLAGSLTALNLIDEFHIILNPVCIGGGKTLFGQLPEYVHLQFIEAQEFASGKLLLKYKPIINTHVNPN
jgi:dihydrofolate reductase